MSWGSAALNSNYVTWMAADKPLLLGENRLRDAITATRWTASHGFSYADVTAADGPISYSYDGYTDLRTYSTTAGTAWRYLLFDFSGDSIWFDTIAFIGTNFDSVVSQMLIRIANNSDFSSSLTTIYSDTSVSGDRHILTSLYHTGSSPLQYYTVPYLSIGLYATAAPEIGEIFIGRRTQLKTSPFGSWDRRHLRNQEALVQAAGGPTTKYVYDRGQRLLRASIQAHETARIGDIETFHRDYIQHGRYPFVWVDQPTTSPNTGGLFITDQAEFTSPYDGPYRRDYLLSAHEQGPDYVEHEL